MASRRQWHLSLLSAVVGAALLAACGGGDSELDVGKVVSFGDSLSDLGTYTAVTQIPLGQAAGLPPFLAGRFTTNTHTGYTATNNTNTATIWVEWVAARVGVPITPAMAGFGATRRPCPVALTIPTLADSCTAYGQGGARVTNPAGWKNESGFLTDPLATQVAAHLAKFGGFSSNDIVFAWTGGNDFLVQMRDLGQGLITPTAAVANMQTTGTELATLIKDQIVAKGAARVVAMTLPDPAVTPDYSALPAENKAFLTQMTNAYNGALLAGLSGTNVKIIDAGAWVADVVARPAAYGFANATGASCDATKMPAVSAGSALFCNTAPAALFTAAGLPNLSALATGANPATWFFADGFHPSTGGHKAFGDFVISKIKEFGWIPANI
jgi:phospholipase/lecithinase/hemolysin